MRVVSGVMAGALNEQVVVEFCRKNLAQAQAFIARCAESLVSAKCVEHDEDFQREIGPLIELAAASPILKVLGERLIAADIAEDDELRSCVKPAVWERRAAWLQQAVQGA